MKRALDYLLGLAAMISLPFLAWWGVTHSPQGAAPLEAALQVKAEAALAAAGIDWAQVNMDGQRAILSGPAPSEDAVAAAAEVVLTSAGPGGLVFGGVTQVESQADDAPPVAPYVWRAIKTDTGALVLAGHVPTRAARSALLAEAARLGGTMPDDQMVLAAGVPAGNWQGIALFAISQLDEIDTGEARLTDTALSLRGFSMDDDVRARVSAAASNLAAPFRGEPLIKGASLWSARHGEGELILAGRVASDAERQRIFTIARSHYKQVVRDDMTVGDTGVRDWLGGVEAGLPHFANFRSGEMAFDPVVTGFSFEGEATGSTLQYLREDMNRLTGPWQSIIVAEPVSVDVAEIAGLDFSGDPRGACESAFNAVLQTNKVYFTTGEATITRESGETLDKLMAVAQRCDPALVFELGGHTDSAGDRAANMALSEARAAAVAAYMEAAGVPGTRLAAIGYGPDTPVERNDTSDGRAKNRRIEFKVLERSGQ